MSKWCHVNGAIIADTLALSTHEALYIAEMVVKHLPPIRGSERDVSYAVGNLDWVNMTANVDEFDQRDQRMGLFDQKTYVYIHMWGDLRDTMFGQVLHETTTALSRLSGRLSITDLLASVKDDYGKSFIFDNPSCMLRQEQTDWVKDHVVWRWNRRKVC